MRSRGWRLFVVLGSLLLVAVGCSRSPTTTRPSARQDPRWASSVARLNQVASQGAYDVIFLGDSITAGFSREGAGPWQTLLRDLGWRGLNLGLPGDRVEHVQWRLGHGHLKALQSVKAPKAAVVLIGTNNLARDTYVDIALGIVAVVTQLRSALPQMRVLLMSIFPRGARPSAQRKRAWKASRLAKDLLARDHGVQVLDIGRHLLDTRGHLKPRIAPDYLHLSEVGYRIWAQQLKPILGLSVRERP